MTSLRMALSLATVATVALASSASSDLPGWNSNGNHLATGADLDENYDDEQFDITSDGTGGAVLVFVAEDTLTGLHVVKAQRVDAAGNVLWQAGGALASNVGDWSNARVVPDGSGGAIVAWGGNSWPDTIVVQRLDPYGNAQWGESGMAVEDASGWPPFALVPDDAGGAIVAWVEPGEEGLGVEEKLKVQRLDGDGDPQWGDGALVDSSDVISEFAAAPDGGGGILLCWTGAENGVAVTRIGPDGAAVWAAVAEYSPLSWSKRDLCVCADGAGGALVTWTEYRNFHDDDVYAQKVDASGNVAWGAHGVPVCSAPTDQDDPVVISDGAGGAIVAWQDDPDDGPADVYVQRIGSSGNPQWAHNGVRACSAEGSHIMGCRSVVPDGFGGAIITWMDFRTAYDLDVYAQRINAWGNFLYYGGGMEICTAPEHQVWPVMTTDGAGGAIIAWIDLRSGTGDFYAQRLVNEGTVEATTPGGDSRSLLMQNVPNPFSGETKISFRAAGPGNARLFVFDAAGRLIRTLYEGPVRPPVQVEEWDGRDSNGRLVPAGTYFYRVEGDGWTETKKMILAR